MNIVLSPQSAELIQQMVASGRYQSAGEVLEDALLALDEQLRLERLRAAIAIGDEQIERGEYDLFTPQLAERLRQEAVALARRGQKPDPDVCP
jgi:antitoxin ParD1/3/4